jgi:hypothetical protein
MRGIEINGKRTAKADPVSTLGKGT